MNVQNMIVLTVEFTRTPLFRCDGSNLLLPSTCYMS